MVVRLWFSFIWRFPCILVSAPHVGINIRFVILAFWASNAARTCFLQQSLNGAKCSSSYFKSALLACRSRHWILHQFTWLYGKACGSFWKGCCAELSASIVRRSHCEVLTGVMSWSVMTRKSNPVNKMWSLGIKRAQMGVFAACSGRPSKPNCGLSTGISDKRKSLWAPYQKAPRAAGRQEMNWFCSTSSRALDARGMQVLCTQ